MKVLVTGGNGYLGARLVRSLIAQGQHEVRVGSRRAAPGLALARDPERVRMDWVRDESLLAACTGVDAVIHAAGMNAADCRDDPVAALEFNGVATARLVRAAGRCGVGRFIHLSTMHVYGAALQGVVDETTCPSPKHPYATSHRAGEDALLATADGSMLAIAVRLSNAYGVPAGDTAAGEPWKLAANDLCRQGASTGRIVLQTAGQQRRDFIPLSEACRSLQHLLVAPAARGSSGLYNVGGGWSPTVLELAQLIAGRIGVVLGRPAEVVCGTAADSVGASEFSYSRQRLLASGFVPDAAAAIQELDALIEHCGRNVATGTHG